MVNELKVMLCSTFKGCGYLNLCLLEVNHCKWIMPALEVNAGITSNASFRSKSPQVDNASSHPRPQSNEFLGAIVFIQFHIIFTIMASKDLNFG